MIYYFTELSKDSFHQASLKGAYKYYSVRKNEDMLPQSECAAVNRLLIN